MFRFLLPPATKAPSGRASPRRGAEENGTKEAETMGRDKGSLTEQQTKGTGTTTIQMRRKHNNEPHNPDSRCPKQDRRHALPNRSESPPRRPLSTGTQRDVTRYGKQGSVWPGGVSPHPPAVPLPGVR